MSRKLQASLAGFARTLLVAVGLAGVTAFAGAHDANAGEARIKAVIELFTSQGCSSCPPADALLATYVARPDVMALTLPVDYWDYLDWKDTFASARYSERQRDYARTRGDGSVYTPQAVINGRTHAVGSRQNLIDKAILMADKLSPLSVPVSFLRDKKTMLIEVGAAPPGPATESTVWLAVVKKTGEVDVRRGENRGRRLKYYNVVRHLTSVGMYTGQPASFRLPADSMDFSDADTCAVFIQAGKGGPIIGAAWIDG